MFSARLALFFALASAPMAAAQDVRTVAPLPWWRTLEFTPLFNTAQATPGATPHGWNIVGGKADFTWKADPENPGTLILHGSGRAPRNAFLTSPRDYGDFLLEVDVRIEPGGGNSGIQVRSHEKNNHLLGYQIEIDSSNRKWSGGLYDEGRRGWLDSLEDNVDAQEAFALGEWNTYRILCVGPRIRTWVNEIPAANHLDMMDLSGRIAFQVHSGRCDVQWRNARIADLGSRSWKRILEEPITIDPEGTRINFQNLLPEGTSVLEIKTLMRSGMLHVVLGNPGDLEHPAYSLRIPAPIGDLQRGTPGEIVFICEPGATRVLVQGAPLVPGPPGLSLPLDVQLGFSAGSKAQVDSIRLLPPTEAEAAAIRKAEAPESEDTAAETGDDPADSSS